MTKYNLKQPERISQVVEDEVMSVTMVYTYRHLIRLLIEFKGMEVLATGELAKNERGGWRLTNLERVICDDEGNWDFVWKYLRDFGVLTLINNINAADLAWGEYVARWDSKLRAEEQQRWTSQRLDEWIKSDDFTLVLRQAIQTEPK